MLLPGYMRQAGGRGEIWEQSWNEAKQAGVDPRYYIAQQKGEIGKRLGRDYWSQMQEDRFMSMTRQFDDLAVGHDMARAPVTSGRRRGVGTAGAAGVYGRGYVPGGPSGIFARHAQGAGPDLFSGYRSTYFKGARTQQPGLADFESLSRGARTQLRNVAFSQFFDPRLSGAQEEAAGGAMKTSIARGIRGKAVSGLAGSIGQRFMAGNRRAALDFITKDILKSQREYAASTTDPGQAILRNEEDIHNFLARASAFNMLSQGRTAFQGQAIQELGGMSSAQSMAQMLLQGQRPSGAQASQLISELAQGGQYAYNVTRAKGVQGGNLRGTQFEGGDLSEISKASGFDVRNPFAQAATMTLREMAMRQMGGATNEAVAARMGGTYGTGQHMINVVTSALQRDLFSPGSSARASDIALGALERDLGRRAGRADYSIDTAGGSADYRRLFESAFSIPGATSGQYSPFMRRLTGPAGGGGDIMGRGTRPAAGPAWMTPELSALRTGTGSERDLADKQNYIRQLLARNMSANQGVPFLNEAGLYNQYNQQMNALRQGSDYLSELRSQFLSPMYF